MALRRVLECLLVAALAVCTSTACKSKDETQLTARCDQLAKACGDKDKHVEAIAGDCKQAADKHVEGSCAAAAIALYDCYEKQLCGKADKVWALDDLRVLSERKKKCVSEQKAVRDCVEK